MSPQYPQINRYKYEQIICPTCFKNILCKKLPHLSVCQTELKQTNKQAKPKDICKK